MDPGGPGRRRGRPRPRSRARRRPRRARRRTGSRRRRSRAGAVRSAYRRLGIEEVISNSARWPTVAPRSRRCRPNSDIRFTVASVIAGNDVEIGPVGRVEPDRAASRARTARRESNPHARRRIRPPGSRSSPPWGAAQPRDRPRVRVGLLELVGGPVNEEFLAPARAWLGHARRSTATARARPPRRRSPAAPDRSPTPRLHGRDTAPLRAEPARSRSSSLTTQPEQRGIPFPAFIHAVESAVVELVAEVQRQMEVVIAQRVVRPGQPQRPKLADVILEGRKQGLADLTTGFRQHRHRGVYLPVSQRAKHSASQ